MRVTKWQRCIIKLTKMSNKQKIDDARDQVAALHHQKNRISPNYEQTTEAQAAQQGPKAGGLPCWTSHRKSGR